MPLPLRPVCLAALLLVSLASAQGQAPAPASPSPAPAVPSQAPAESYPPHPDSLVQPGVPVGDLIKFEFSGSRIFPGTSREVTVYVPKQYRPETPACVYVNQDGVQWNAPVVFDNLIARGEIPVIIGVFVRPGVVKAAAPAAALDRFNRSLEYDGLGEAYARFLLDELLPAVETRAAPDGRPLRLSHLGRDRAIGGSSSGAIAAFTAAWERPDAFSRVFSAIGTYVGLRGGDGYATLVRKTEPKPLRIFLQDGSNDLNIYGGDWWMANQTLQRALAFAGYDTRHVWGEGGHNGRHGTAVFPDAIRWLWRDWPAAVTPAGPTRNPMLAALLRPGEGWSLVAGGFGAVESLAVSPQGELVFSDTHSGLSHRVGREGRVVEFPVESLGGRAVTFGADGRLRHIMTDARRVVALGPDGAASLVAEDLAARDLVSLYQGDSYALESGTAGTPARLWRLRPDGSKRVVDDAAPVAGGLALSPDQTLLYASEEQSHWVVSYQIQPDGSLAHRQRYYWLHQPDTAEASGARGMACDAEGRLYVATHLGIQICDQAGRVNAILPVPGGRAWAVALGGERLDQLFVSTGDRVYRRALNTRGVHAWAPPVKPAAPRL